MTRCLASFAIAVAIATQLSAQTAAAPVYVTLWFDTEDYILPQDDDATKRLAEMLTQPRRAGHLQGRRREGSRARARGREDVIAALKKHDIGYHSNTHSQQPTIAVYLQNAGWEDGRAEFYRREAQGARDVAADLRRHAGRRTASRAARGRRRPIRRCTTWASACIWTKPITSASTISRSITAAC